MDDLLPFLIDLHKNNPRQAPGSDANSAKALEFLDLPDQRDLQIADVGCGTGAQTFSLAQRLNGHIYAIDLSQEFLDELKLRLAKLKLRASIETLTCDMANLPFAKESLDLIWAEGSIYNLGFKKGLSNWKDYLRPGGYMALSELSWLKDRRPKPIETHWKLEYPGIQNIPGNIQTIFDQNLESLGHFMVPVEDWKTNYYKPLEKSFAPFLERNKMSPYAQSIVEGEKAEIAIFDKYSQYFGYVFYLIRKPA